MPIRIIVVTFVAISLMGTGCGVEIRAEATPSQAPLIITSTIPATLTPAPSETALAPLPQPTTAPVEGITTTQVNVRAEPSTGSSVLGIIPPNTRVEITGKDPGESWWQINYAQGVDGKGWVTAQYITTASTPQVSVIGGNEADPNSGSVAVIQQQLNVRSGPGTDFNSLGTLNPQDVVSLTGKDPNGAWLQIEFASGPEGKGWVNAAFVRAQGVDLSGLPIITEEGQIVGTGTPTSIPPTPTATLLPAWEDHDSPTSPVARVVFAPTGTRSFIYSGDLSAPEGDLEDWISFQSYTSLVFASLECKGSDSLQIEIIENTQSVSLDIACGDQLRPIPVKAASSYLLHLEATSTTGNLQYVNYVLTIKTKP